MSPCGWRRALGGLPVQGPKRLREAWRLCGGSAKTRVVAVLAQ